jgi:hypothetical protein
MAINSNMRPAEMFQLRLLNQMGARRQRRSPTLFSSLADALRTAGTAYASGQITQGAQDRREAANADFMRTITPRAPEMLPMFSPEQVQDTGMGADFTDPSGPRQGAAPIPGTGYQPGAQQYMEAMLNDDIGAGRQKLAAALFQTAIKPKEFGVKEVRGNLISYDKADPGNVKTIFESSSEGAGYLTPAQVKALGYEPGTVVERIITSDGRTEDRVRNRPRDPIKIITIYDKNGQPSQAAVLRSDLELGKPIPGSQRPLSPGTATAIANSEGALRELEGMETAFIDSEGTVNRIDVAAMAAMAPGTDGRSAGLKMRRAIETLLRTRTGAAAPDTEVDSYMTMYGPSVFDKAADIKDKLKAARQYFQRQVDLVRGGDAPVDINSMHAPDRAEIKFNMESNNWTEDETIDKISRATGHSVATLKRLMKD